MSASGLFKSIAIAGGLLITAPSAGSLPEPQLEPTALADLDRPNAVVAGVDISNQAHADQWARFCQGGAICAGYDDLRGRFINEYRIAKPKRRAEMERELAASVTTNGFIQWGRVNSMLNLSDPRSRSGDIDSPTVRCSTYISRSGRHASTTCR